MIIEKWFKLVLLVSVIILTYNYSTIFPDFENYNNYLLDFDKLGLRFIAEPGYVFLSYFIILISDLFNLQYGNVAYSFSTFFFLLIILFLIPSVRIKNRINIYDNFIYLISPFLFFLIVRTPREAIALFFIVLAFKFSINDNKINYKSIIFFTVAISIHISSSVIFLSFFIFYFIKKSQIHYVLFLLITVVFYIITFNISTQITGLIIENFNQSAYEVKSGRVRILLLTFSFILFIYYKPVVYKFNIVASFILVILVAYFLGFVSMSRVAVDMVLLSKFFLPKKYFKI